MAARFETDRKEAADYVAQLAGELAAIAQAAKLPLSAYLLEMARLEARRAIDHEGLIPPPARGPRVPARSG